MSLWLFAISLKTLLSILMVDDFPSVILKSRVVGRIWLEGQCLHHNWLRLYMTNSKNNICTVKPPNLEHTTWIGRPWKFFINKLIMIVNNFCMKKWFLGAELLYNLFICPGKLALKSYYSCQSDPIHTKISGNTFLIIF